MSSLPALAWAAATTPVAHSETSPHRVQFYESDTFLAGVVGEYLASALRSRQPALVIATEPHRRAFCAKLAELGVDADAEQRAGRFVLLDAAETLSRFMVDGAPDPFRFGSVVGAEVARRGAGHHLHAYGEMVDLLWRAGNGDAALRLESLWNELGLRQDFSLLCAYSMDNFTGRDDALGFQAICCAHSHVVPTERFVAQDPAQRDRYVAQLQQRVRALEVEAAHQRELEQSLRDFLESCSEPIHAVDATGKILWANRAELEMLGYPAEGYIGHHLSEFYADPSALEPLLDRLRRNETVNVEGRLRCRDGSIKHVLIHSNAHFREGEFLHSRCFTRDVTALVRLREQLELRNEELARGLRYAEIFSSVLAHDLRNPLAAMVTAASLLQRRADSEKTSTTATRIVNNGHRMGRLIDQLLDFTRVRLGAGLSVIVAPGDLGSILLTVMGDVNTEGRVQVKQTGDLRGEWDGDRLIQLLTNLVSNALKHGEQGAPVTVDVDGSGPEVVIRVHNRGVVPLALRSDLFQPFKLTAGATRDRSSGLGLGLFIADQIVKAHGGTIDVTTSLDQGTCFSVTLPRQRAAAAVAPPPA